MGLTAITNLFHCPSRNRMMSPVACPTCHLSKLCKTKRDTDERKGGNHAGHYKQRAISAQAAWRMRQDGMTWEKVALAMECSLSSAHKAVKRYEMSLKGERL